MINECVSAFAERKDEEIKISSLNAVSDVFSTKVKHSIPNETITSDFLKELYNAAFNTHENQLSTATLRFIETFIAKNDSFDLKILNNSDINLVTSISEYIKKASKTEITTLFSILTNLVRRSKKYAKIIIKEFPFTRIIGEFNHSRDDLYNISTWCHVICYQFDDLETIAPFYQYAFPNIEFPLESELDSKILHELVSSVHQVAGKSINISSISPPAPEISKILFAAFKTDKLTTKIMIIDILHRFWLETQDFLLFSKFMPKFLVNRIQTKTNIDRNNSILTSKTMDLLADLISAEKFSFEPEKEFMENLREFMHCNNIALRESALKLSTVLIEYGNESTKLVFIDGFIKQALMFLKSDENDDLLYALRFTMSLCMFARSKDKINEIINDVIQYKEIVQQIAEKNQDWMIQGFAKALDGFINEIQNPQSEEKKTEQ